MLAGNEDLELTYEVWKPDGRIYRKDMKDVSVVTENNFPFIEL